MPEPRTDATDGRGASLRARTLPRAAAFWTVAATVVALLAASSAPSPLYPLYQREFGFSALELTTIFAVYVLALLISLLTVGRLSDFVGRRPVLAAALVVQIVAMAVFLAADGTGWLLAARVVQGFATGAAIGVLGAYLLDLQPTDGSRLGSLINSVAPAAGLGIGAFVTGLLVQFGPHPTRLIFLILIVVFALLLAVVAALPETVRRMPGALAALRPRVAVPPAARRAFMSSTPTMISTWALGGLMLSVGGSLVESVFGHDTAVVGVVLGAFAGSGAVAATVISSLQAPTMERLGVAALLGGGGLFIGALASTSFPVFVIAAVVAGCGFGAGFLGALRSVTQLAQPHERAALLSAVYVASYVAFSIPALVAGVLITHIGLRDTALYYGSFVVLAAIASLAVGLLGSRAAHRQAALERPTVESVRQQPEEMNA